MNEIATFRSCATYADNIQFEPVKSFESDFWLFLSGIDRKTYIQFRPYRYDFLDEIVDEI